jgi:hypothetical protein
MSAVAQVVAPMAPPAPAAIPASPPPASGVNLREHSIAFEELFISKSLIKSIASIYLMMVVTCPLQAAPWCEPGPSNTSCNVIKNQNFQVCCPGAGTYNESYGNVPPGTIFAGCGAPITFAYTGVLYINVNCGSGGSSQLVINVYEDLCGPCWYDYHCLSGHCSGYGGVCIPATPLSACAVCHCNSSCASNNCGGGVCQTCETVSGVSITPSNTTGCSPSFTFKYRDSVAATNLSQVQFQFAPVLVSGPPVNLCVGVWDRATNTFNLRNDAGTGNVPGGAAPGSVGFIQNNQCIINFGNVAISESGTDLTLSATVIFKAGFNGVKQVGLYAASVNGPTTGAWVSPGNASYTVNASPLYNSGCVSGGCPGTYDCSGNCVANACNGVCCSGVCCPSGNSCCGPECCAPGYGCDGTHCAIIRSYECVE